MPDPLLAFGPQAKLEFYSPCLVLVRLEDLFNLMQILLENLVSVMLRPEICSKKTANFTALKKLCVSKQRFLQVESLVPVGSFPRTARGHIVWL